MRDDWVTVTPEAGAVKETARALLSLARVPADVRTDGNGDVFRVPAYLADMYIAPAPEAPRPRRRTKKEEGDE